MRESRSSWKATLEELSKFPLARKLLGKPAGDRYTAWLNSMPKVARLGDWQIRLPAQTSKDWLSIRVMSEQHIKTRKRGHLVLWDGENFCRRNLSGIRILESEHPVVAEWVKCWVENHEVQQDG